MGVSMNREKTKLGKEAVKAALHGEWQRAVELNRDILGMSPNDCEASNRLAKALMELGQFSEARQILETLCQRVPSNNIARKNLARLDQLGNSDGDPRPSTARDDGLPRMFIAESGKSCITILKKSADAVATPAVAAGDVVALRKSGEGVAGFAKGGGFLGMVDRRLGRRLHKLMAGGNQYAAAVVGTGPDGLSIILRETGQNPALRNVVSFPSAPGEARPRPAPVGEPSGTETFEDDGDLAAEDLSPNGQGDDDEAAAIAIADVVVDDQQDDDDVPVLDADVDSDSWKVINPDLTGDPDWE